MIKKVKAETNLTKLLQNLSPTLHDGDFIFTSVKSLDNIPGDHIVMHFREMEGITLITRKEVADQLGLEYEFVAAWITLEVHSALEAVGLTAAFSSHLAKAGISCNVVAGFYHDHIFVAQPDAAIAMEELRKLSLGEI